MKNNDVIIIGAGPAGILAAVQLKRYNIESTLFEKSAVGGLLKNANLVENCPGFPDGVSGKHFVSLFEQQLEKAEVKVQFEKVLNLDYKNGLFFITTDKRSLSSLIIIIASGTKPCKPDFEIPAEADDHIFYEVCHLDMVKNKEIAIIGAGDAAFDYALNLSKNNNVIILNRQKRMRCLPLLWKRFEETKNTSYFENITLKSIKLHDSGLILNLHNSERKSEYKLYVHYLLFAIGRKPNLDFLSDNVKNKFEELQEMGKLYMIGDIKNGYYRQVAIASGDGIKCAMKVYKKLKRNLNESFS